jgi:hypothetical protein
MTRATFKGLLIGCDEIKREIDRAWYEYQSRESAGSNDRTEVRVLLLDAEESCKTLLRQIQAELG